MSRNGSSLSPSSKPKLWKMSLLAWAIIYPLVNILTLVIGPYLQELSQLLRTLILTGILAPSMVAIMSVMQRKAAKWLCR